MLFIKTPGMIAKMVQIMAPYTASVLVASSAEGKSVSSYIITHNQGANTHANCPINCEVAMIDVLS